MKKENLLYFTLVILVTSSLASIHQFSSIGTTQNGPPSSTIQLAMPGWWDANWTYRRELLLNYTIESVYDYALCLDFDGTFFAGADSTGKDLRFIDEYNNTLSYWIEEWDLSSTCLVWVKVPEIIIDQIQYIHIYYGNQDATPMSNGTETFLCFDDFESGYSIGDSPDSATGWSIEFGSPTVQTVPSGREGYGLTFQQLSSESFAHGAQLKWSQKLHNISVGYYWSVDTLNIRNGYHHFFNDSLQMTSTRFVDGVCDWWDGSSYHYFTPSVSYSANTWYRIEQIVTIDEYLLKTQLFSTPSEGELTHLNEGVNAFSWRSQDSRTYNFTIDNVYVRQYLSYEPAFYLGDEEQFGDEPISTVSPTPTESPTETPTSTPSEFSFTIGISAIFIPVFAIVTFSVVAIIRKRLKN